MSHRKLRLFALVLLYPAWLSLQLFHELGHVLHAWLSGARGIRMTVPLLGFSKTDVDFNPHPAIVAWGGPVWGVVIPMLLWLTIPRRWTAVHWLIQGFSGLCLIGNGAYLAVGWIDRIGDAGDLMRQGTPHWALIAVGLPMVVIGLWMWHRMGAADPQRR